MIETQTQPVTSLKAPELTKQNLVTVVTKIQPFRKGGIRLQHEEINDKHVFHNYGHGSSGISLAYGSAFLAMKQLTVHVSNEKPRECAVIGSGLIALLTALELVKNGQIVTMYADKFPKYGEKDISKKLASQVDEGLWLPFGYDMTNKLRHQIFSKISYENYTAAMKSGRYQSFKIATVYERDTTVKQLRDKIPPFLYNYYKNQNIDFGNGKSQQYIKFKTIKVDTQFWLEQLRIEASLRGIQFVETKFNNISDILKLKENCIFNCSGYSSKYLFNDVNMTGTTDHLVIFKNPNKLQYSLSANLNQNLHMRIHCSGDKIILRSESKTQGSSQQFVKNLIKEAQVFFQNRTTKAKL